MNTEESLETTKLKEMMSLLPGFSTKCLTAQHKSVQHHSHDNPKQYWCCWVTKDGKKFFAMYDGIDNVKTVTEDVKNKWIVKPLK